MGGSKHLLKRYFVRAKSCLRIMQRYIICAFLLLTSVFATSPPWMSGFSDKRGPGYDRTMDMLRYGRGFLYDKRGSIGISDTILDSLSDEVEKRSSPMKFYRKFLQM